MLAIADSSALIALAVCDALKLIEILFKELKVPQTVFNEVIVKGKRMIDLVINKNHNRVIFFIKK